MGAYDFQRATADRIAEIFRKATVAEDGKENKKGGQRRILLADEVGLGKTIIAREVISRVRDMRKDVGDDMFRVVYVCSNMNIVSQNIANLGIKEKLEVSESRLSMQHLIIAKKDKELKQASPDEMPEMIIPLTPGTSFSQNGSSIGNRQERALMAVVLSHIEELQDYSSELKSFFRSKLIRSEAGWQFFIDRYTREVNEMGPEYIRTLKEKLNSYSEFDEIKRNLLRIFNEKEEWQPQHNTIINNLRRIFADISLSMLQPDLIIMDEFQRFSSLLDYKEDNEQSAIAKKFFEQEEGQEPMILLLSATPYKPFSTLEELNEYNVDDHYEDFNRLMDFLFSGKNNFREVWSDYSHKLSHLHTEKFDVILASKKAAQDKMYEAMCRTERLNEGLLSTKNVREVPISQADILSYVEMQKIVQACKEVSEKKGHNRFHWSNMPVEYVKSAPYLLSFMDSYELKKQIESIYRTADKSLPMPSGNLLLHEGDIMQYRKIPMKNARMQLLRETMLPKGKNAELLLWVPASKPYYSTNAENPFVKNKDFSKTLVFSAWEMVPRMIATLLTYYVEREVIFSKYKKASYEKRTGGDRIKKDAAKILTFPSEFLSSLYDPSQWFGEKIHVIKANIKRQLKEEIGHVSTSERRNYSKILSVLTWLDDRTVELPADIPANTIDILVDMAVASPATCLYRILKDKEKAHKAAEGFVTLFNRRIAGYIIDRIQDKYHGDELYLDGVIDYCVLGNLQAVLDEYRHMCSSDDEFFEKMNNSFIREVPLQVDTFESFYKRTSPKKSIRTFYAVPFAKGKKALDEKGEKRINNIRLAFQSPFYPFVLASTSVGQEGLDFHWYCRKIVHWNLPSNPQDLEQREGRINRYKCLAIRRNLSHRYPEIYHWDQLFETANRDVRQTFPTKYSEMVPNWCLPTEWLVQKNLNEKNLEIDLLGENKPSEKEPETDLLSKENSCKKEPDLTMLNKENSDEKNLNIDLLGENNPSEQERDIDLLSKGNPGEKEPEIDKLSENKPSEKEPEIDLLSEKQPYEKDIEMDKLSKENAGEKEIDKLSENNSSEKDIEIEWIERIVPQYPMSNDVQRYRRLIEILSLYRLTMGQPRQEELLQMLETSRLTQEQIDRLLFDLSPIHHHHPPQ